MLTLAFNIQPVKAEPRTWTVDDDGPADFHTIQEAINAVSAEDTIYVKAGTYYENVVVNKTVSLIGESKDNTIIDGDGIDVVRIEADNVSVSNFTIQNGGNGILFSNGKNITISHSIIKNNVDGILLNQVYDVVIQDNIVISNGRIVGSIMLGGSGVWAWNSFNIKIDGNNVTYNYMRGIGTKLSGAVSITQNIILNNSVGSALFPYATASGISITSAWSGTRHVITDNIISNHTGCGIILDQCYNGGIEISKNTITNIEGSGIYLKWSKDNVLYGNNFINNKLHASIYSANYPNTWDDGYPSGGNYWSDYTGVDANGDGIGDIPYVIDADNQDRYPLLGPFNTFDAGIWNGTTYNVGIVSNSTVSNFQLDASQKSISFNTTGAEGVTGFCRVTIPNLIVQDLWQGNYTVLLNGEPWPFRNWTDATNTYIYVNYTHSEHQIIIIPEFPSATILPLFMSLMLVAVVLAKRRTPRKPKT
jgi:parallel beta-helix repeat protein